MDGNTADDTDTDEHQLFQLHSNLRAKDRQSRRRTQHLPSSSLTLSKTLSDHSSMPPKKSRATAAARKQQNSTQTLPTRTLAASQASQDSLTTEQRIRADGYAQYSQVLEQCSQVLETSQPRPNRPVPSNAQPSSQLPAPTSTRLNTAVPAIAQSSQLHTPPETTRKHGRAPEDESSPVRSRNAPNRQNNHRRVQSPEETRIMQLQHIESDSEHSDEERDEVHLRSLDIPPELENSPDGEESGVGNDSPGRTSKVPAKQRATQAVIAYNLEPGNREAGVAKTRLLEDNCRLMYVRHLCLPALLQAVELEKALGLPPTEHESPAKVLKYDALHHFLHQRIRCWAKNYQTQLLSSTVTYISSVLYLHPFLSSKTTTDEEVVAFCATHFANVSLDKIFPMAKGLIFFEACKQPGNPLGDYLRTAFAYIFLWVLRGCCQSKSAPMHGGPLERQPIFLKIRAFAQDPEWQDISYLTFPKYPLIPTRARRSMDQQAIPAIRELVPGFRPILSTPAQREAFQKDMEVSASTAEGSTDDLANTGPVAEADNVYQTSAMHYVDSASDYTEG